MDIRKLFYMNKKEEDTEVVENSFLSTIVKIKQGDKALREEFIADHKPFIIRAVSRATGRFIDNGNCDEYSIGIEAFNEAIDSFNIDKKRNFFSFSEQVIKRRMIDYFRKNSKHSDTYPFSSFDNFEEFESKYLTSNEHLKFEEIEAKEDIFALKDCLLRYGITMTDLVFNSPKHADSRRLCIKIARILAEDEELFGKLKKNKSIPRNELVKRANVHRRTIENNRKFIIAVCLILKSNLEISKRFFKYAEIGGSRDE